MMEALKPSLVQVLRDLAVATRNSFLIWKNTSVLWTAWILVGRFPPSYESEG